MANKKWLYTAANVLLYAVGFPALFIFCLVKSLQWNSYGMYGASSFAPLIAVIILWVITGGVQAAVYNVLRKKGGKAAKNLMIKIALIPVAVLIGIMGILDIAMPPLLKDATSNTILYEDVTQDWQTMHDKLYERVELFKTKNKLDSSVKYTDEEFQKLFHKVFKSMDRAYNAFDPLAIEIALDQPDMLEGIKNGNFPIMVAATLLLKTTGIENGNDHTLPSDTSGIKMLITENIDSILTLVNDISKNGLQLDSDTLNRYVNTLLVTKSFDGIEWNIFNILGTNMIAPDIDPNAALLVNGEYVTDENGDPAIDENGDLIPVYVASLGYQDMAWLNGIPMMFFIPLMSVRNVIYIFAALIAIFTMMQFFIAEIYAKKNSTEFSLYMFAKDKPSDSNLSE